MILWLCVLVRIVANPFSNVFQKLLTRRGADPLFIICITHGLLSIVCVPIFLLCLPPLPVEFWAIMAVGALFTVSGNVLIVEAVKRSDLSVLGPINSYKSVVSLIPGVIFLNETPGSLGLGGIALIVAGSYFLVDQDVKQPSQNAFVRFFSERGIQYRFAALVLSAIEAVVMKKALLLATPLATFAAWSLLGFALALLLVAFTIRGPKRVHEFVVLRENDRNYALLFVTTGLMQLCTIVVLEGLQVGYALALFQISTLLSVLLGWKLFHEGHFVERLVGSLVMAAGAVLIIWSK